MTINPQQYHWYLFDPTHHHTISDILRISNDRVHRTAAPDAPTVGPTRDLIQSTRTDGWEHQARMTGPSKRRTSRISS
ncbi:uncharacterized protein CDV56_107375 [Aspergillus thermomutatus]|uniref:Uncharacterized protein n=1 Tax=Aspergillus thermomutatus TaxID=41047 RepID=A0A397HI08_ASPTH|nr:uncharacterized protein CDV56_107375 [Aspergillus thermomutatus]RHZ62559.1 hypothetical protein CDV56_107375 [Aspergillus thermomutatus]